MRVKHHARICASQSETKGEVRMRFGTRSRPRVKVVGVCLRGDLRDEVVGRFAKASIRREGDSPEVQAEFLVLDDRVR